MLLSGGDEGTRRTIATFCAIPTAVFLLSIGILHSIVNVSAMRRAIERGDIPPRLGGAVVANAAFSGAAMGMLGLLVLLVVPGLRAGSRQASRLAMAIGIFLGVGGIAGYLWSPTQPAVLIFLLFGALLSGPFVIWRRDFAQP
jgi:hypothetical protein